MITSLEFLKLSQKELPYEEVDLVFNGVEWVEDQRVGWLDE